MVTPAHPPAPPAAEFDWPLYYLNRPIAEACARARVAYFDLTEDVGTTAYIRQLARQTRRATFMPQCGLAPGAINIVGGSLASSLDSTRAVEMRVGALPQFASNQMKYYLSWSTLEEFLRPQWGGRVYARPSL
ncbi:MAG: hypothetical protein Q7S40_01150 [Opitutaceae bacterium]|nr:hypothetical protein [Opitutaceae bacterium]